jgi:hypothetical protein
VTDRPVRWTIGGQEALTRQSLRQAIRNLARRLDDPRFDDWDDELLIHVLGQIIDTYREHRDAATFHVTGQLIAPDALNDLLNKITRQEE